MKQCGCGAVHTTEEWQRLEYVGVMEDGEGGSLELRNCPCGSTIAIELSATNAAEPSDEVAA